MFSPDLCFFDNSMFIIAIYSEYTPRAVLLFLFVFLSVSCIFGAWFVCCVVCFVCVLLVLLFIFFF